MKRHQDTNSENVDIHDDKLIPAFGKQSFACPRCNAFAHQKWMSLFAELCRNNTPSLLTPDEASAHVTSAEQKMRNEKKFDPNALSNLRERISQEFQGEVVLRDYGYGAISPIRARNIYLSVCESCHQFSVWKQTNLIFPNYVLEISPHPDLPEEIKVDFIEAGKVVDSSPRSAAAIIRLCVQKLCIYLGLSGKNLNEDIGKLVERGLPNRVQRALDAIGVIGNNAVHPGVLDLQDDRATAIALFKLLNFIVEKMITEGRELDTLYEGLPQNTLAAIEDRNQKKQHTTK